MTTLVYEPGGEFIEKVMSLPRDEITILCPRCRAPALFAPDSESAAKLKIHPGIVCSKNWKHFSVTYHLKPKA